MREVRAVEVPALVEGGVARRVEDVWNGPRVARRPLVEVVRNVERRRVWRRVLEVDDNNLCTANRTEPVSTLFASEGRNPAGVKKTD